MDFQCLPGAGIGGLKNTMIFEPFLFLSYRATVIYYMNIHCQKTPYYSALAVFSDSDLSLGLVEIYKF